MKNNIFHSRFFTPEYFKGADKRLEYFTCHAFFLARVLWRADESAARKATAECAGEPQASSAVAYCVVRGRFVLDVSQRLSVSFVFSVSVSPICGWQTACQQNRGGANTFGGRLHLILPHAFLCTLLTTFDVDIHPSRALVRFPVRRI